MSLRTSEYTIFVKLNKTGNYLLIHGYTGAIDVVSPEVVKVLKNVGKPYQTGALEKSTLEVLQKRGYLTEKSPKEERRRVSKLATMLRNLQLKSGRGFLFVPAYDCNFQCPYCYEAAISRDGTGWTKKVMTREIVDAAYAAINQLETSVERCKRIMLYGGEPLLARYHDTVSYIVEQGVRRGHTFGAITNGFELDTYRDLLSDQALQFLQITLDGDRATHDRRRRHATGSGTFDRISSNISLALDAGVKVSLRVNVDQANLDGLERLAAHIEESGWRRHRDFSCYVYRRTPTYLCQQTDASKQSVQFDDHHDCPPASSVLKKAFLYEYIAERKARDKRFVVFREPHGELSAQIVRTLKERQAIRLKAAYCGANTGTLIFDPFGDVYACWEQVGLPQWKIGSFFPTLSLDVEKHSHWLSRSIETLRQCSKCKFALFCAGGCQSHALQAYGDGMRAYCAEFPKMFLYHAEQAYYEFTAQST